MFVSFVKIDIGHAKLNGLYKILMLGVNARTYKNSYKKTNISSEFMVKPIYFSMPFIKQNASIIHHIETYRLTSIFIAPAFVHLSYMLIASIQLGCVSLSLYYKKRPKSGFVKCNPRTNF